MRARMLTILTLLVFSAACSSSGGLSADQTLTAAQAPLAGPTYQELQQLEIDLGTALAEGVTDVINAPFLAIEGALGINNQTRRVDTFGARFSPAERLAQRRTARGLPSPAGQRVAQRQSSNRYALEQLRRSAFLRR